MTAHELVKALRERANLLDEPHYSPLMRDAADRLSLLAILLAEVADSLDALPLSQLCDPACEGRCKVCAGDVIVSLAERLRQAVQP